MGGELGWGVEGGGWWVEGRGWGGGWGGGVWGRGKEFADTERTSDRQTDKQRIQNTKLLFNMPMLIAPFEDI